jgi:hypothetical protein
MNMSGTCGASSKSASAASSARARQGSVRRSPSARLPIWSWFCTKLTKAPDGSDGRWARRAGGRRECGFFALVDVAFGQGAGELGAAVLDIVS